MDLSARRVPQEAVTWNFCGMQSAALANAGDVRKPFAVAMVIVVRSRTVNRTSRLATYPCNTGTSAISLPVERAARVYIPFIANLKLPFKFDRS